MITRIVQLNIQPEHLPAFKEIFYQSKPLIEAFGGCEKTDLFNDLENPTQCFTISYWHSDEDLQTYRSSDLFKTTWAKVKPLFAERARAWSLVNQTIDIKI
ncbi:MAG TPA: antibiotic biosynthesis monooxygenase family protein [Daejeonella sp.]|nr:antibiotic biosynthesis monooxygenase family protein [Daejeonella sp.]